MDRGHMAGTAPYPTPSLLMRPTICSNAPGLNLATSRIAEHDLQNRLLENNFSMTVQLGRDYGSAGTWQRSSERYSYPLDVHMQSHASPPSYPVRPYTALHQPPRYFNGAHASSRSPGYPLVALPSHPHPPQDHSAQHWRSDDFSKPRKYSMPHLLHTSTTGASIVRSPVPADPESDSNNIIVSRPAQARQLVHGPQCMNEDRHTAHQSSAMQEPAQEQPACGPSNAPAQPPLDRVEQSSGDMSPAVQTVKSLEPPFLGDSRHLDASEQQSRSLRAEIQIPQTPSRERQTGAAQDIMDLHVLPPNLFGRARNPRRPATKLYREAKSPDDARKRRRESTNAEAATPQTSRKKVKRSTTAQQKKRAGSLRSAKTEQSWLSHSTPVQEAVAILPVASKPRPERDEAGDQKFVEKVLLALEPQTKRKTPDMGKRQAIRISSLLRKAEFPDPSEAQFLATDEAAEAVSTGKFFRGIIVTTDQQTLPLQTVEQFLDEYYEDNAEVWIQDPSVRPAKNAPIVRKVKMKVIKQRFAAKPSTQPWNLLELATHCDDGLRPHFLNTEDCRLLTKIKIPDSADQARRRTYEPGYKEVEKWALLAQAGALTEPHQDSHGYSTYITINVGLVGFGWLSAPTEQDRKEWRADPVDYTGGNWRYIVLKPGQTIYFPAGTVHFVFRLAAAGNTLAFGGHILRCSNIVHWVKTLIEERDQKNVTNEDLTDSATGYLSRVEKFVKQAIANGQAEKWGGEASIEEFLRLKEDFGKIKQR